MRYILYLVLLSFLWSCSNFPKNNIASGYFTAYEAIESYFNPAGPEDLFSVELIDNIPYASSLVTIGQGSPGLVILESIKDSEHTWLSADKVYIVIRNGRVIKTAGLPNNLIDFRSSRMNINTSVDLEVMSYYSYDEPALIDLKVTSTVKMIDTSKVSLFNRDIRLTLYEEYIQNEYLGWKETNKYWVDAEGFVWKTIQYISPKLPPIKIEVTKKPAS